MWLVCSVLVLLALAICAVAVSVSDYEVHAMAEQGEKVVEADVEWHKLYMKPNPASAARRSGTYQCSARPPCPIVKGNLFRLRNPIGHFSFKEPVNGCGNGAAKPSVA